MKISKSTALFLAKVLFHYEVSSFNESVKSRVKSIRSDLNDFLLGDVDGDLTMDEEASDPCVDCGTFHRPRCNDGDEEKDVQEEIDEEDGETGSEIDVQSDEEEAEDEKETLPECTESVLPENLHALKACRAVNADGQTVTIEFEDRDGEVDLLEDDGQKIYGNIVCIQRSAKSICVWTSDPGSESFTISKFPKDWVKLLTVNDVYSTSEDY